MKNCKKFHPLVSVIIPTYNRSWALEKTVKSVYKDSYRPIECIVVDDGSTDDTVEVVAYLERACPEGIEFRYLRKENGGSNSARNTGMVECKGNFICFLDSDDYLINDSIQVRATALIGNPDVELCYGWSSTRDEEGKEVGRMNSPWPSENESRIAKYLFHTNSPLIRRNLCEKAGLWREDMVACQEYEYFSRVKYWASRVIFIDEKLSVYTKHSKDSIFDYSTSYFYYIFRSILIVKGLILYSKCDGKSERNQLSKEFHNVAKMLCRGKDYLNASRALEESLMLRKKFKVLMEWIIVKCLFVITDLRN